MNKFIESKLNIYDNTEISLINLPIDYVFDPSGNFKDKICMHIRDAVNLMGMSVEFEPHINDKILQKLIFLFLINSLNKYPENESWAEFIKMDEQTRAKEIIDGISLVWSDYQSQIISNQLSNEFDPNGAYFE